MDFSSLRFLPFVIFGVVLLVGGHYFVYRSLLRVFKINRAFLKLGLTALFFILPISFFVSAFLAHFSQSQAARLTYIISAYWLGLALNLLLAAILIWAVSCLLNLAGLRFNRTFFGAVIFLLAIGFSAYGFWNAWQPQVRNLKVEIKNLPAAWQDKTIVQLSDLHLGRLHGVNFLQDVVAKVNAQSPDLVLITGDLFDGMDGGLDVFVESLNNLQAKNGVFFVTGNHESYVGLERALAALRQTKIRVLVNEAVNINGLQIIGLDYAILNGEFGVTGQSNDAEKIITSMVGFDRNQPSILMYHAPTNIEQARAAGINFQLSGHSHRGQVWPFEFFTGLIYGRYDYGLSSLGDFTIYTTNGVGTWGPPMRTGNTPEIPVFKLL